MSSQWMPLGWITITWAREGGGYGVIAYADGIPRIEPHTRYESEAKAKAWGRFHLRYEGYQRLVHGFTSSNEATAEQHWLPKGAKYTFCGLHIEVGLAVSLDDIEVCERCSTEKAKLKIEIKETPNG